MESNNEISSNNINLLNKEDLRDKVGIKNSNDKNKNMNHNYALINFKLPGAKYFLEISETHDGMVAENKRF